MLGNYITTQAPLCWLILTFGKFTLPLGVGMFESLVSLLKFACPFLSNIEILGPIEDKMDIDCLLPINIVYYICQSVRLDLFSPQG